MLSTRLAALAAVFLVGATFQVEARQSEKIIICNQQGCSDWFKKPVSIKKFSASRRTTYRTPKRATQALKQATIASGSGIVRSHKTGATARVSPVHATKFQGYINDLEAAGASVRFMGGYRKGRCSNGSKHPCGMALDVCQLSWGVVDSRCNLPSKTIMAKLAKNNNLFEGGQWCDNDMGHAEAGKSLTCNQRKNLYSAISKFKKKKFAVVVHKNSYHKEAQ